MNTLRCIFRHAFLILVIIGAVDAWIPSKGVAQLENDCGLASHLDRFQKLGETTGRPILSGPEQVIGTTNFQIHYTLSGNDATTQTWAESVAVFSEQCWTVVTALGWALPPPDYNMGGDNRYDIYIGNTQDQPNAFAGTTYSESSYPSPYLNGYSSWIQVSRDSIRQPFPKWPRLHAVVAHEFHHACQFRYSAWGENWFYENTSVYMEPLIYNAINTLPYRLTLGVDPLDSPHLPINLYQFPYYYCGAIWPIFLHECYASAAPRRVWERMGEITSSLEATDWALQNYFSSNLPEALKKYAVWRYFTGSRADAYHFIEGSSWPSSAVLRVHSSYPANGNQLPSSPSGPGGTSYIEFLPGAASLNITFFGENGYTWGAYGIGYRGPSSSIEQEMSLNQDVWGVMSMSWCGNSKIVFVPTVTQWSGDPSILSYTYSATLPALSYVTFTNAVHASSAGGKLLVNSCDTVTSGQSRWMADGSQNQVRTLQERFLSDSTYKHNNWRGITTEFRLSDDFIAFQGLQQTGNFVSLRPAIVRTQLIEGGTGGTVKFRDPWYVEQDGNQPDTLKNFTSPHSPTGDYSQSSGGVFRNQSIDSGKPYYSVGALSEQPISGTTSYFLNWTGTDVAFQNTSDTATGVVFTSSGATAIALYKGHLLSTPNALVTNNQRKVAGTPAGVYCIVYESASRIWAFRVTGAGATSKEFEVSTGSSGSVNSSPSITFRDEMVNVVWQSTQWYGEGGFNQCYVHLRKYNAATDTWGAVETVQSFEPPSADFASTPVLDANALSTSGSADLKMVAWREPDGIKIIENVYGTWSSVGTVSGTNGNSCQPSIVNYSSTHYAICWEDSYNATIRYAEVSQSGGNWNFANSYLVSPVGWESNQRPSMGFTYIAGQTPTVSRPTVVWQSYNNIVEGGSSVHVRQLTSFGTQSWGDITSFSMSEQSILHPAVGTFQTAPDFSVIWCCGGNVYKAMCNGTSWGDPSIIGSGSLGGSETNINMRTQSQVQAVWRKPTGFIRGLRWGTGLAKTGSEVGGPDDFNTGTPEPVAYRLTRHGFVDLAKALDVQGVGGNLGFEIAHLTQATGSIESNIDFAPRGLASALFTANAVADELRLGVAIYGLKLSVQSQRLQGIGEPLVSLTLRQHPTAEKLQELWSIPVSELGAVEDSSFGAYREFVLPLGEMRDKQLFVEVEMVGGSKGLAPLIVDDYIIRNSAKVQPAIAKEQAPLIPASYALYQNYPNPFNPQTTITFDLPEAEQVLLKVYNVLGEEVMTVAKGWFEAGTHVRSADFSGCASGVYLYRITAGTYSETKRMLLVR